MSFGGFARVGKGERIRKKSSEGTAGRRYDFVERGRAATLLPFPGPRSISDDYARSLRRSVSTPARAAPRSIRVAPPSGTEAVVAVNTSGLPFVAM